MYLVHYNQQTKEVLGYLDAAQGIYAEDDGTGYFSISDNIHDKYSGSAAWTDGKVITNVAPPNEFADLTADGWVVDEEAQTLALEQSKKETAEAIDDTVAAIYMRFQRFQIEYDIREKQALAFKANNYEGNVPSQVLAYAEPAGITAQASADSILQQAAMLRAALDTLGKLRMQKVAVSQMTTIENVEAHKESVLAQIQAVAEQL